MQQSQPSSNQLATLKFLQQKKQTPGSYQTTSLQNQERMEKLFLEDVKYVQEFIFSPLHFENNLEFFRYRVLFLCFKQNLSSIFHCFMKFLMLEPRKNHASLLILITLSLLIDVFQGFTRYCRYTCTVMYWSIFCSC